MMGRKIENGRYTKCYSKILTKEYLETEYPKRGCYAIAHELDMNVKTIYNYLEYYNIPRDRKSRSQIKSGDVYGLLTMVEKSGKLKNGTIKWKCKCVCGKETTVPASRIKAGKVKSCGCLVKNKFGQKHHKWTGYCGISGSRLADIKIRAKKKNLEFDLDAQFLWEIFIKQDRKCAITGKELDLTQDGSVDRIDSSRGYTKNNVWWVTKDINKMKLDFTLDYFIHLCEMVANNKEKIKDGR